MKRGPELSEQSRLIIEDRKRIVVDGVKMTYRNLAKKYNLTYQRIQEICKQAGVKVDMRKYRWDKPIDINN